MKPPGEGFKIWYAISVAFQLGFYIIIPLAGFTFLGVSADKYFKTPPFFLGLGVIIGLVTSGYGVYDLLLPFIKKDKNKKG